jgi:hypothetical protein
MDDVLEHNVIYLHGLLIVNWIGFGRNWSFPIRSTLQVVAWIRQKNKAIPVTGLAGP